jgi:phosphoribosylformimino-5-aminoimidazole carboxamide ribotide isomerase
MRIIPAIDVRQGRCVRLWQGDYEKETVYSHNPLEIARGFQEHGFTSLHVVDLDGAKSGIQANTEIVRAIASGTGLSIQLGGGIRDSATIRYWLQAGVERCVIGSLVVEDPGTVRSWVQEFGAARIMLALDVRMADDGVPWLSTHGWTRASSKTLWQCLDEFLPDGLTRILCTDIRRDGAMTGPNLELYREIGRRYPALNLQASGGVRHAADLAALRDTGVHAAITGRALLDGRIGKEELEPFLRVA